MAAAGAPLNSKASNVRNFHNQTKDIPAFDNEDNSKFLDTIQTMEIWLDERDCKYVANRDDNTRRQFVAMSGYLPTRITDNQDIFWSCIFIMFHAYARFRTAIHPRNILLSDYSSQVWKMIYAIIKPEDFS